MSKAFELFDDEVKRKALRYIVANRDLGIYNRVDFVEECLKLAWQVYLPYPALRVKPMWWDTEDGQGFAIVEWVLYQREMITQAKAAKLLGVSLAMVWKLTQRQNDLRVYRKPNFLLVGFKNNPTTGQTLRPYYMRRSQVMDYLEKKEFERGV